MSLRWTVWADWKDVFPEWVRRHLEGPVGYAVLAVVGLVVLLVLAFLPTALSPALAGGRSKGDEDGLREKLAEYPPPGPPGTRRLTVEGIPVRVRLVVVAPLGKEHPLRADEVEDLLEEPLPAPRAIVRETSPGIALCRPR